MERERIVIIDGNSLINRAYYAIQRPMITKEGLYTQGVYGFLNMLNKIKTDYPSKYMVVTFDRKAPTFRHLEYDQYKAGRKKMPPELLMQLPLLKDLLSAMNIKMMEIDGFEADDIIGTLARQGEEEGLAPFIITGDKDELQLATDVTKVLITRKGISEFDVYDRQAMIDKYGFTPEQFIDYKGLMGDPSDHIPGLPGVGEKTAQKLILKFGSVAALIQRSDEISTTKLRQTVEENAELAVMSRRLATIFTEVPIEIRFEECLLVEPDYEQVIVLYKKLEFNSFLKKLQESGNLKEKESKERELKEGSVLVKEREVFLISDVNAFVKLEEEAKEGKPFFLKTFSDENHRAKPIMEGIVLQSENYSYYIKMTQTELRDKLIEIFCNSNFLLCGHQLQRDYYVLLQNGFPLSSLHTFYDTALSQYLIEPTRTHYELDVIAMEFGFPQLPSEQNFLSENGQLNLLSDSAQSNAAYGEKWCSICQAVYQQQASKLAEEGLEEVLQKVELPLIAVLASMESYGMTVDKGELKNFGMELKKKIRQCEEEIYNEAGEVFNINSPKQLGVILFEKLQLPGAKKTKTGYATGAEILERLEKEYPIVSKILNYRTLSKLNSTYVEGLMPLIDEQGKIHAHFQQTVTATGRISCTEPNLQNIPIRQELGRRLRKVFIPESEEYILVGADYSQIELRVLASLSKDESLIEAFNQGDDIHRITASKVFGIPEDEVTSLQRSNAKAVNFGVIYGISGFGLSNNLNITRKEAEKYIDEYFKKYFRVKEYMDETVKECKEKGYVTTLMGRRRSIPEITASNFMVRQAGERLAMNTPIQGSAADIIKLAMIKVSEALAFQCKKSTLILQVHDELILQAHKSEWDNVQRLLKESMESAVEMQVKLLVDLHSGENWMELK